MLFKFNYKAWIYLPKVKQKEIRSCYYVRTLWKCPKRDNLFMAVCLCTPAHHPSTFYTKVKDYINNTVVLFWLKLVIRCRRSFVCWCGPRTDASHLTFANSVPGKSVLGFAPKKELLWSQRLQLSYRDEPITINELWKIIWYLHFLLILLKIK